MRKNNLVRYVGGLGEATVRKEQEQIDLQYLKLLKKLEVIMEKIKERRDDTDTETPDL